MKWKLLGVVALAALLNGRFAQAQSGAYPGYGAPPVDSANPYGVPAPFSPDHKFRPADPNYVPPPFAPQRTGPDGMPNRYPPAMPYGYPPPGMMPYRPMMGPPPGMMPGPQFLPPMPGAGQPYMVPRDPGGPDRLPAFLPPLPKPAPEVHVAPPPPIPETQPVAFEAPAEPSLPQEPYMLYEGGRSQKGLFSCEVQSCYHVWGSAEFLYWRAKASSAPPPLATTSPPGAAFLVNGVEIGVLGRPDTTVVLGGQPLDVPSQNGARFTLGAWLDPEQQLGIEATYFFIPARNKTQTVSSTGDVTDVSLFNPILEVNPAFPPGESAITIAGAGVFGFGSASLTFTSQLQGAELNLLHNTTQWYGLNINVLAGFRYLNLWESIQFTTTQQGAPGLGLPPEQFVNTFDLFKTRNNFYGGQVGVRADYQYQWFFINSTAKIAYGNMVETVTIDGSTTTNTAVGFTNLIPTVTVPGGVFAQPTNIGVYHRNRDAFIPEVTVNAGVQVFNWLRVFGGYNFLYVNHVARPGDQIDRTVNTTQVTTFTGFPTGPLVGPANPAFIPFRDTNYWVQGLNFGLEVRY